VKDLKRYGSGFGSISYDVHKSISFFNHKVKTSDIFMQTMNAMPGIDLLLECLKPDGQLDAGMFNKKL